MSVRLEIKKLLDGGTLGEIWRVKDLGYELKVERPRSGLTDAWLAVTWSKDQTKPSVLSSTVVADNLAKENVIVSDGFLVVAAPEPTPEVEEMPRGVYNRAAANQRGAAVKTVKVIEQVDVDQVLDKIKAERKPAAKTASKRPYTRRTEAPEAPPQPPVAARPAPSAFATERARIEHAMEILQGQLALLDRLEGIRV